MNFYFLCKFLTYKGGYPQILGRRLPTRVLSIVNHLGMEFKWFKKIYFFLSSNSFFDDLKNDSGSAGAMSICWDHTTKFRLIA